MYRNEDPEGRDHILRRWRSTTVEFSTNIQVKFRLGDYAKKLHEEWRVFYLVNSEQQIEKFQTGSAREKREKIQTAKVQRECFISIRIWHSLSYSLAEISWNFLIVVVATLTSVLNPILESTFISYTMMYSEMMRRRDVTPEQAVEILSTYSYLNFCRSDFPAYTELIKLSLAIIVDEHQVRYLFIFSKHYFIFCVSWWKNVENLKLGKVIKLKLNNKNNVL